MEGRQLWPALLPPRHLHRQAALGLGGELLHRPGFCLGRGLEAEAREKHGKAFSYWPRVSREMWLGEQAARVLTEADVPADRNVLMAFLDSAEEADPELLDRLSKLIEQRRRGGAK